MFYNSRPRQGVLGLELNLIVHTVLGLDGLNSIAGLKLNHFGHGQLN